MTERDALLHLVKALWAELAAERDGNGVGPATGCFDQGRDGGPVREAVIDCYAQNLGEHIDAICDVDVRLPCLQDSIRTAFQRDRARQKHGVRHATESDV